MTTPQTIRGSSALPFANEVIALFSIVLTLGFVGYSLWVIQKEGLSGYRRSSLFFLTFQICLAAAYLAFRFG